MTSFWLTENREDVFFMSQCAKLQPHCRIATFHVIMLILLIAGGCVASHPDLETAREEKAAASIRLAKAITQYCSVASDTINARDACIVDRRLSILQADKPEPPPLLVK
jgi:hypothetical protein